MNAEERRIRARKADEHDAAKETVAQVGPALVVWSAFIVIAIPGPPWRWFALAAMLLMLGRIAWLRYRS